jgi:hypothetical protein
MKQLG